MRVSSRGSFKRESFCEKSSVFERVASATAKPCWRIVDPCSQRSSATLTRCNNHRLSLANILLREFLNPVHPCTCGVCYLFRIALCEVRLIFDHTLTSFFVFLPDV